MWFGPRYLLKAAQTIIRFLEKNIPFHTGYHWFEDIKHIHSMFTLADRALSTGDLGMNNHTKL